MKIFISSTFKDLKEHRAAVIESINRMQQRADGMEIFGARNDEPLSECVSEIKSCNCFVGIYAHRYGSINKGRSQSITEIEYECAKNCKIPIFCFIIDEEYPWPPPMTDAGSQKKKLLAFKRRIKVAHLVDVFTTPSDLATKVSTTISRHLLSNHELQESQTTQHGLKSIPAMLTDADDYTPIGDGINKIGGLLDQEDDPALYVSFNHIIHTFVDILENGKNSQKNRYIHIKNVMNNLYSLLSNESRARLASIELYIVSLSIFIHGQDYEGMLSDWQTHGIPSNRVAVLIRKISRVLHSEIKSSMDNLQDRLFIEGYHVIVSIKYLAAIARLAHDLDFFEYQAPDEFMDVMSQSILNHNNMLRESQLFINRNDSTITVYMEPPNFQCQNYIFRLKPKLLLLLNECNKVFLEPVYNTYKTYYKSMLIKIDNDMLRISSESRKIVPIDSPTTMYVYDINVRVHESVMRGHVLFSGESAKNEISVTFPYAYGTVKSIFIGSGDCVSYSQPVMAIEIENSEHQKAFHRFHKLRLPNEMLIESDIRCRS